MKEGGPGHAITVRSEKAPGIAQDLSGKTGWEVKRVSLKARNSETAIPDAWEKQVLEKFDQRQAAGENVARPAYAEIIGGQSPFMKAQDVKKVCMNCLAAGIAPETVAALLKHYPNDMA